MTENKKNKGILKPKYRIKGIELVDFKLNRLLKPLPPEMIFHFNLKIEHRLSVEQKLVLVTLTAEIYNDSKEVNFGSMITGCAFEVVNINEFIDKKSKSTVFPQDFIDTLNSITVSTSRGVMFSQFRGTYLHNAILPDIDIKSFSDR